MLYFSKRSVNPDQVDSDQLEAVRTFRRQFQQHSITGEFYSPEDLERQLSDHLTQAARELRKKELSLQGTSSQNKNAVVDTSHIESDRALFQEIRELIPSTGSIDFIRNHDYGGAFRRAAHNDLVNFDRTAQGPEFEFADDELENLWRQLVHVINEFLVKVGQYTYPNNANASLQEVPPEWRHQDPKRHRETVSMLHEGANAVCETYDRFIHFGRWKLGV